LCQNRGITDNCVIFSSCNLLAEMPGHVALSGNVFHLRVVSRGLRRRAAGGTAEAGCRAADFHRDRCRFLDGRGHQAHKTAQGERFDASKLTAAHRTLPLNTTVRVTNVANRKTIKVRINDRGPYVRTRIIDLSERAARDLDIAEDGTARVRLEVFASDQADGG
jgi:rare lipoprotein A